MKLDGLAGRVAKCAEMNMSQSDIADLLRVAPSTIHRITNQLGIQLQRKVREHGPNSNYYRQAGEGEFDYAERAEDVDEAQFGTEASRAERAAREAEDIARKSPEERLNQKLEGVESKSKRYEITYGHFLLEFEKMQHKLGNRGPLPSKQKKESSLHKGALEMAHRRKEHGVQQGERLLAMMTDGRTITAAEASVMLGDSVSRTSSYLNTMFDIGQLYRARDLVKIPSQKKRQWRWVFSTEPLDIIHGWD
jgi:hypothetical protein